MSRSFSIFQKRSPSNGNMSSSIETSSKSKPTDDVEIDSEDSSDEKISKPRQVVPAKPPQARVISGFTPEKEEKKEKKVKKTEKPKRKNSVKASEEGAIEPAPQILFAAGDEEVPEKKKKKSKKSKDGKKKKSKKSKKSSNAAADAQSFVPAKLARSTERFDESKSVVIKRNPALSNANVGKRPPLPDSRGITGLARSQFAFEPRPSKKDTTDDPYVTILTIPTDAPENPRPKSVTKPKPKVSSSSMSRPSSSSRLPLPNFSSLPSGTDGLKPLETMAETVDMQTNAFNQDGYHAAPIRRHSSRNDDLLEPIKGWLKFQVAIIPKPDDVEYEREATKQFDISRLLHQAKTC